MKEIPQNIRETSAKAIKIMLPIKPRATYDGYYGIFLICKDKNVIDNITETVVMLDQKQFYYE